MEDNLLVVLGERGLRQEVQALSDYNQMGECSCTVRKQATENKR